MHAQQTFNIKKEDGALKFIGATAPLNLGDALTYNECCTLLTITGNDAFSYVISEPGTYWNSSLFEFSRKSDSSLVNQSFNETDPATELSWDSYHPVSVAADPAGHLAMILQDSQIRNQLASYTVDGQGNIKSTNTWRQMPTLSSSNDILPEDINSRLSMSPEGNLLAVEIQPPACQNCDSPWGLQLFHFNGANPITPFSPILLPDVIISHMAWDNSNHLYAVGSEIGGSHVSELYVYTVTPTSITTAPGSPYPLAGLSPLIVVPKL
jgi:hypothetical protein